MEVNQANFRDVARAGYKSEGVVTESEFNEDVARINQVVRSLNKVRTPSFNEHLLINQMITLLNVFELSTIIQLISFKIGSDEDAKAAFAGVMMGMDLPLSNISDYVCNTTRLRIQQCVEKIK